MVVGIEAEGNILFKTICTVIIKWEFSVHIQELTKVDDKF